VWNLLVNGDFYRDPGADYFSRHVPAKTKARAIGHLESLGYRRIDSVLTAAAVGGGPADGPSAGTSGIRRKAAVRDLFDVPLGVTEHVRGHLGLGADVESARNSERTAQRHRGLVREQLGVVYDQEAVRKLVRQVIFDAAQSKDNPADLIGMS